MRKKFLQKEFTAAGATENRESISPTEFRAKYGTKVVEQSEKVI